MKLDSLTYCRCCKFQNRSHHQYRHRIIFNPSNISSCIDIYQFEERCIRYFSSPPWRQSRACPTSPSFPAFIWTLVKQPAEEKDPDNKNSILYRGNSSPLIIRGVRDALISGFSLFSFVVFHQKFASCTIRVLSHSPTTQVINYITSTTYNWTKQTTSYTKIQLFEFWLSCRSSTAIAKLY